MLDRELAKKPEELREPLRSRLSHRSEKAHARADQAAQGAPDVDQLSAGSLYLYDRTYGTKHADELKKMTDEAAEIRKRKPVEEFVPALHRGARAAKLPATFLFNRGDRNQPKEQVAPGELTVLAALPPDGDSRQRRPRCRPPAAGWPSRRR